MHLRTLLVQLLLSALLAACGATQQPTPTSLPQAQEPLVIYGWAGYMPQSILDAFSEEYGIATQYVIYGDQNEALEQMRAGARFDVIVLDNVNVPTAAAEGLLAQLDFQNIPNFRNLGANFRDLSYDPENEYSIMIQWGTTGLIARTDRLSQPVTAWADLWNPEYTGKIGIWPYADDVIGFTLKSLGYPLNSQDPDELNAARENLLQLRKKVFFLDSDLPTGVPHLLDDQTVMIYGWSYDAMQAQEQLDTAVYVLPKEGTILWSDNVTVSANSGHKQIAEQFIDFLLRPEVSAQMVNELWVPSPNEAARPFIQPEILNNPLVYPPNETLGQAEFYEPISEETRRRREQIWAEFLAEGDAVLQE